jgi:pilus assembly protein CpaB
MKSRRVPLIIGLVLALGTGALLLGYLTSLRPTTSAAPTRSVLVATHDIPAGTAATSDLFTSEQRNASDVDSDAISDPVMLAGEFTLVAIPAGSVVTSSKISVASAATLPARLAPGMRAASIAIDNVKGVAGLIAPGDRVDVIAVPPRVGDETPRGVTILRDVLVLAMGADVQTTAPAPMSAALGVAAPALTTVTLALTSSQAEIIAGADINTTLRLALRNPHEPAGSQAAEALVLPPQSAAASSAGPAALPTAAAMLDLPDAAPVPAAPRGVIVIDGDRVSSGSSAGP